MKTVINNNGGTGVETLLQMAHQMQHLASGPQGSSLGVAGERMRIYPRCPFFHGEGWGQFINPLNGNSEQCVIRNPLCKSQPWG